MMRQTGGLALGATSTRSSSCSRDRASASGRGRTPSCSPSAPTRKTSRARMRSLILTSCAAMWSPASFAASSVGGGTGSGPGRDDGGHGNVRHQATATRAAAQHADLAHLRCCWVVVLVARWGHCTQARGPKSRFPLPCYAGRDRISCQDTRVSSIWTPSGEHQPDPGPETGTDAGSDLGQDPGQGGEPVEMTQEQYQELLRARAELAAIPVADIVANHAIGLQQLAVIHLLPDPDTDGTPGEPRLAEASLAIDALGALVDTLGDRLAPHHEALREAVSQLRLAFVELSVTE